MAKANLFSRWSLTSHTHTYRESIPGFLRHLLRSPNFWKGAAAAVAIARTKQEAKLATREQLRRVLCCLLLQVTVACLCLCRQQRHACTDTSIHLDRTGPAPVLVVWKQGIALNQTHKGFLLRSTTTGHSTTMPMPSRANHTPSLLRPLLLQAKNLCV